MIFYYTSLNTLGIDCVVNDKTMSIIKIITIVITPSKNPFVPDMILNI